MYYTIDPYYDVDFYNQTLEALKNNNIEYSQFLSMKAPYYWYLKLNEAPFAINYDEISKSQIRFLVSAVKPVTENERYLLIRRTSDAGAKNIDKFVNSEPYKDVTNFSCFFSLKSREEAISLSKDYPGKIWYFGKYYNNKYMLFFASDQLVVGFLDSAQILASGPESPGFLESHINWKVFVGNDNIVKFSQTPYFQSGKYYPVNVTGSDSSKFRF